MLGFDPSCSDERRDVASRKSATSELPPPSTNHLMHHLQHRLYGSADITEPVTAHQTLLLLRGDRDVRFHRELVSLLRNEQVCDVLVREERQRVLERHLLRCSLLLTPGNSMAKSARRYYGERKLQIVYQGGISAATPCDPSRRRHT